MTAIFLFSAQNGDTSNNTSNFVITLLEQLFHLDIEKLSPSLLEMLSFVVRKCAHMSEYALLCILWVLYMKEAHFTKAYMLAYGLTVIYAVSDEIHQDFIYKGNKHLPFVNVDASFKEFTIICTAPSKTFNLAGLQTSNILFFNHKLKEKFIKVKSSLGFPVEPTIFGIEACKAAYNHGDKWVDELVAYLDGNIKYLDGFLKKKLPMLKMIKPQGLYLVWVDFSALQMTHEELEAFMVNEAKLWLDEGYIFGVGGAGFERFNLAMPRCLLVQALDNLYQALKNRQLI